MMRLDKLRVSTFTDSVFATGEGYTEVNKIAAVALPYKPALNKFVQLTNPDTNITGIFPVLDVGPYFWWDYGFIENGHRPLIEIYFDLKMAFPEKDEPGKPWSKLSFKGKVPTSRAAVDVTPEVWRLLGIPKTDEELKSFSHDNMIMEWFVDTDSYCGSCMFRTKEPDTKLEDFKNKIQGIHDRWKNRKEW